MKIKSPARDDVSIDMGPMIDLVFLLLIFFMVASVVTELDKAEVAIPESTYAKVPENTKDRMVISVDSEGQVYIGLNPVSNEELQEEMQSEIEKNENLRVVIRADKNVQFKTSKEIMMVCGEVGATDLIYASFEGGES